MGEHTEILSAGEHSALLHAYRAADTDADAGRHISRLYVHDATLRRRVSELEAERDTWRTRFETAWAIGRRAVIEERACTDALIKAIDEARDMMHYVDQYFLDKWKYRETFDRLEAVVKEGTRTDENSCYD